MANDRQDNNQGLQQNHQQDNQEAQQSADLGDAVGDFDFVSDFSRFRCLRSSGDVMTLYKKKADKVRPVNQPHEGGLKPGGRSDWRAKAILKEQYKPSGKYGGWLIPKFSDIGPS